MNAIIIDIIKSIKLGLTILLLKIPHHKLMLNRCWNAFSRFACGFSRDHTWSHYSSLRCLSLKYVDSLVNKINFANSGSASWNRMIQLQNCNRASKSAGSRACTDVLLYGTRMISSFPPKSMNCRTRYSCPLPFNSCARIPGRFFRMFTISWRSSSIIIISPRGTNTYTTVRDQIPLIKSLHLPAQLPYKSGSRRRRRNWRAYRRAIDYFI